MKNVLWFSRHDMTPEQLEALGDVVVTKVNGNMSNVHMPFNGEIDGVQSEIPPFKELVKDYDIIGVVLPINLKQQVLAVAGGKPVIEAKNTRIITEGEKVAFQFNGWFEVKKIEVVVEPFNP